MTITAEQARTKSEKLARAMDGILSGRMPFNRQIAAQVRNELRAQAAEIERLTRERDEAVSATQRIWNVAIEQAAYDCADYPRLCPSEEEWTRYDEQIEHSQENIRALLKDDATAALARRDAQMKAEGMREAAEVVRTLIPIIPPNGPDSTELTVEYSALGFSMQAILSRADEIERESK